MELFIHSLSGAFSLWFQLTCKLHWPHLRKLFFPHSLTLPVICWIFPCPITPLCQRRYLKVCPDCRCCKKGGEEMIKNISVTPLLTKLLIYSDFPLLASTDHLAFWSFSYSSFVRREQGTFQIKCPWMSSLVRNCPYSRNKRLCPRGPLPHLGEHLKLSHCLRGREPNPPFSREPILCWAWKIPPMVPGWIWWFQGPGCFGEALQWFPMRLIISWALLPTGHLASPAFAGCPGARPLLWAWSPCWPRLLDPVLWSGWIDFTNTHLQTLLLCFGKSTQLHRIRPIKHEASWGSISSAWRVLHHSKLWLLQPHTSNLFHFSVQSR